MGCAYMLAILADPALNHPALECCFTTGEETGLIGAQGLKKEFFKGRRLINLDGGRRVPYLYEYGRRRAGHPDHAGPVGDL